MDKEKLKEVIKEHGPYADISVDHNSVSCHICQCAWPIEYFIIYRPKCIIDNK